MVIGALSFDIPSLNRSCKELEEMAVRVLPQLRGQLSKNKDVYLNFGSDYLEAHDGEIVGKEHYVSYVTELERLFEIAKIAFEQKMIVLFGSNEIV